MKRIKFISLFKLFKDDTFQESMISLNNSIELLALYRKLGWRIVRTIFTSKVKTQSRMRTMYRFFTFILTMRKNHGEEYTVKYLKLTQLSIQKCIGGKPIKSLRELDPSLSFPRVSNSGLPLIIPLSDRRAIMNRSKSLIRFWLTLFSLYRIVKIKGSLKLNTITDPYSGSVEALERVSTDLKFLSLKLVSRFSKTIVNKDMGISLIETSSPTHKVSWAGVVSDPLALARNGLAKPILEYMTEMGYSKLLKYWVSIFRYANLIHHEKNIFKKISKNDQIGQLSMKEEAAGKIRVFAMVDVWTQSVLKPLHLALFNFLQSLPNDGTFDQTASWKRCIDKAKVSGHSFGYDLSAATDRLPIDLQVAILSSWIGEKCANLWKQLLVGRDYHLVVKDKFGYDDLDLRYAVGQPMGALSSWAMLAVTHHLIVQLAYTRTLGFIPVKYQWYDNYELLGDDIIIFDEKVADSYLQMMEELGVPINLSKSVVAVNPTTEFAKVTTHFGDNVSALSWKMFISQNSLIGRVNILWNLIHKSYLPSSHLGQWLIDVCAKSRYKEGVVNLIYFPLLTMFCSKNVFRYEDLLRSLYSLKDGEKQTNSKKALAQGVNSEYLRNILISLIKGKELRLKPIFDPASGKVATATDIQFDFEVNILKELIARRYQRFSVTPFDASRALAPNMIKILLPIVDTVYKNVLTFDKEIQVTAMEMAVKDVLTDIVYDHLKALEVEDSLTLNMSLQECLEYADKKQRSLEISLLVERAMDKLNDKKKQVRTKRPADVSIIIDILKVRKFASTWSHMNESQE